ncbi:MAG: alanine/glycine:cation symporter family protein [Brevinema sp.]
MEMLNALVDNLNNYLYSYVLVIGLLGTGLYFTIATGFVQFRWGDMSRSMSEGFAESESKKISPFQAFAVTTASRVGTGNLAGVALAIMLGGPGAVFWMWLTALLGGALAFVEATLAQVYKVHREDKTHYNGGPAFYMMLGLNQKWLGAIFSVLLLLVFGFAFNSVQANTIALAVQANFQIPTIVSATVLAILTAIFIFGGLPRIAKITSFLVPIMAILYLILSLYIVIMNISHIGSVFSLIFVNAFNPSSFGIGTTIGVIVTGVKRGLFSNEAGMGSAPNAAASAETSHPVKQGMIQACGVFFDTLIICSATAFLILFSGVDIKTAAAEGISGIVLTQRVFGQYFGGAGSIFLTVCIFLLAFSSVLGNYFYAQNALGFLTEKPAALLIFRLLVVGCVFAGSVASFSLVWNIADLLMGFMAVINIYAVIRLFGRLKKVLADYNAQKAANVNPQFKRSSVTELKDVECWD